MSKINLPFSGLGASLGALGSIREDATRERRNSISEDNFETYF
tara:strand:- start:672 stop:800 length:129 start_codon:yes stop_codon:yes gene_type:complete